MVREGRGARSVEGRGGGWRLRRRGIGAVGRGGGGGASSRARLLETSPRASAGRRVGAERRAAVVGGERLRALLKPATVKDGVGAGGAGSTSIGSVAAQLEGPATSGAGGGQGPWPCSTQNRGSHGGHGPGP